MKSICIKTTNQKTIEYLLEKLGNFELDDIYFSYKQFKIYKNIIIHFTGKNEKIFIEKISEMLTCLVLDLFEETIINNLISNEYFYFDNLERKQIENITIDDLYNYEESIHPRDKSFDILFRNFYNYLLNHKSIVLKGFVTFRIKNYFNILLEQIDKSVNKFLIEREYTEFISLLRMYVNSESSSCNIIHLVYHNFKPLLLDENKNIINIDTNMFNAKYLSDISFSSNDYALNTLLNLIPKKIYIHLIDNNIDEFINTIKLIFEDRVSFCTDCSICKLYKKSHAIQQN